MATKRMLPHTVTLYNYIGEVDDRAHYQPTVIRHCYAPLKVGVVASNPGRRSSDSGDLYIFDGRSKAYSPDGSARTYLPHDKWMASEEKDKYWTLSDDGKDFYKVTDRDDEVSIRSFSHKVAGTKRMFHFEVRGK